MAADVMHAVVPQSAPSCVPGAAPYDFATAGREVLAFLHKRLGFALWMITRVDADDWIVLQAEDHGYGVGAGAVFSWADSFCAQMVQGHGPHIAPDADAVPAYAQAHIGKLLPIKSYIGMPLVDADGHLFGTLCGIDPRSHPDALKGEQPLIEMLANLLNSILHLERLATHELRRAERLEIQAKTDALTGLFNRRAWDELLLREEERCRRYGHPTAVFMVDLDELKQTNDRMGHAAGDALLQRAALAIQAVCRSSDIAARLGGDEFGLLVVECDRVAAEQVLARLVNGLNAQQVEASIGLCMRHPSGGLQQAARTADQAMYRQKALRKAQRP